MADKNTHRYGNRNSKRSGGEMKMSTGTRSSRHSQNKTAAKRSAAVQRSASRKHPYGSHETAKGSTSSRSTARRTSYRSSASNTAAGARQSRQKLRRIKKEQHYKKHVATRLRYSSGAISGPCSLLVSNRFLDSGAMTCIGVFAPRA